MQRIVAAVLLIAGLALTLSGCLFEPRSVESPLAGIIDLPFAVDARTAWNNAQTSLDETYSSGWEDVIGDNFVYVPDSDTRNAYPDVDWDNWNAEQEIEFANRFFSNISGIDADLFDEEWETPDGSGGQAEWEITYLLEVTDQAQSVQLYRGRAIIHFFLEGNEWVVDRWEDLHGEPHPETQALLLTMGGIRGAFASK